MVANKLMQTPFPLDWQCMQVVDPIGEACPLPPGECYVSTGKKWTREASKEIAT